MKSSCFISFALLPLFLSSCMPSLIKSNLLEMLKNGKVNEYTIPSKPSLRGVDVLDNKVVWVSGSKGTYARSIDAGSTWKVGTINNDTLLDFRDIQALSVESAIAISAGSPARIYKTVDGGKTWSLKYENTDSLVFFNSFDFCDGVKGFACSDPIKGNFLFIKTINGGETWDTINHDILPKPLKVEGGFAASGSSVICSSNGVVLFGTGGEMARIIRSDNFGKSWEAIKTPIKAGDASYGIYSVGFLHDSSYIITGGCWKNQDEAIDNVAISSDFGKSWTLTKSFPSGFRSSIKYLPSTKAMLTCGTNGMNISINMGETWLKVPLNGYNAIDLSVTDDFIVLVGSQVKIAFVSSAKLND